MQVPRSRVQGEHGNIKAHRPADLWGAFRPGALIAGTWAVMQYMGERYEQLGLVDTPYLLRVVQWIHSILQGYRRGCQKDSGRYHARDSRALCAGQAARFRRRVRFEVTSGECDGSRRRNVDQGLALERAQQPPGGPYCVYCKSSFPMEMTGMPLITHSCSAADLAGG